MHGEVKIYVNCNYTSYRSGLNYGAGHFLIFANSHNKEQDFFFHNDVYLELT